MSLKTNNTKPKVISYSDVASKKEIVEKQYDSNEDIKSNEDANLVKARILTSWKWAGIKFWIITDAGHEIITVLLPEEY